MAADALTVEQLIKDLNRGQSVNIVDYGVHYDDVERIPFGVPELDRITYGGIPCGRLVEFYGQPSGGKTTTALALIASAQRKYPDKKVVFVDIEMTFDSVWAEKMGVVVENVLIYVPVDQSAGQILNSVLDFINTKEISLVILDSIGAMVSDQELEKSVGDKTYAGVSAELTRFSKKAVSACASTGCVMVGINQQREDMNSTYGLLRTPGGKAWQYLCSVRMEFKKDCFIDNAGKTVSGSAENPAGQKIRAAITKSKCFPSDRKIGTFTLKYLTGLDIISDTIESAVALKIIAKSGAWFSYKDYKWQGQNGTWKAMKEDNSLFEEVSALVAEQLISS